MLKKYLFGKKKKKNPGEFRYLMTSGPPRNADHVFRIASIWTEPIH